MEEFIELVKNMRRLQKQYFKSKDPLTLRACKQAEQEVDQFLNKGATPSRQQEPDALQPSLF